MFLAMERTEYDWQYHTEPHDKYFRSLKNGCYWPRGKMLGGTHGINALIYFRGNREDYDNWARLGNPTWDYDSVLEYFKKTERNWNQSFVDKENQKWHSDQGEMPVDCFGNVANLRHVLIEAAKENGYGLVDDLNADEAIGFTYMQGTMKNGQRFSTAKSFLIATKNRKNLHVIKHAHVTKVIIDNDNTATGVEFTYKNGHKFSVTATKEIILSAGAISTPQLLMLSGIGPKEHLQQFNIPVVQDLSVGKNLQDHIARPILFQFHKSTAQPESIDDRLDDIYNYAIHRKGNLAGIGSTSLAGLINSENHTGYPDIKIQCSDYKRRSIYLEKHLRILGYDENVVKAILDANADGDISDVYVELLRPESTGEILLQSSNPFDQPRIIPNYFDVEDDANTLVRGIQFLTSFLNSKAFKEHEGELVRIPFEDCDKLTYRSEDYWKCYLSQMGTVIYHQVGTAKMGPDTDKKAVVDSELRVKGINRLRVIDASIMPKMVSANTNAATIMIGEKGADFIESTWQKGSDKTEL